MQRKLNRKKSTRLIKMPIHSFSAPTWQSNRFEMNEFFGNFWHNQRHFAQMLFHVSLCMADLTIGLTPTTLHFSAFTLTWDFGFFSFQVAFFLIAMRSNCLWMIAGIVTRWKGNLFVAVMYFILFHRICVNLRIHQL